MLGVDFDVNKYPPNVLPLSVMCVVKPRPLFNRGKTQDLRGQKRGKKRGQLLISDVHFQILENFIHNFQLKCKLGIKV